MVKKLKPMHPSEVLREEFLVPAENYRRAHLPRRAACYERE
jgi:plasmid maintenance system antidote protein VapI